MIKRLLTPGSIPQLVGRHMSGKKTDVYFPFGQSSSVLVVVVTKHFQIQTLEKVLRDRVDVKTTRLSFKRINVGRFAKCV